MSETDNRDPSELPSPMAARADAPDVDDGDDEGDEGPDDGEGSASPGQPAAPGTGGRRRRRRRRRRGAQVLFTPEGQAYRMVAGPDGQPQQVFLTPQELQQ